MLTQKLHKLVIKKFLRRKVHARFKDNIWVADLPVVTSLSSKNRGGKCLPCVIDMLGLNFSRIKKLQ